MISSDQKQVWRLLLLCSGLALLLTACSGPAERLWPDAPGWSRAVLLGSTRSGDPVQPGLDALGTPYYLLASETEQGTFPRLVGLGSNGEVFLDRQYDVPLERPDQPRVLWDGRSLRLLWISDNSLYDMSVEAETGEVLVEPRLLSGEQRVDAYDVVANDQGSLSVWFAGPTREPGLYAVELPQGEPNLVDPQGVRPRLVWDEERGTLHAIWSRLPPGFDAKSFWYGHYPSGRFVAGLGMQVAEFTVDTSTLIVGPTLAVAEDGLHVFWSEVIRTGMQAGSAEARHLHFSDPARAQEQRSEQLFAPLDYHLTYDSPLDSYYQAGARAPLQAENLGRTGFIMDLTPVAYSPESEVAVATTSRMNYLRRKTARQVGVMYLEQGEPGEYQLLSFTPGDSETPGLTADRDGYLYATWLERSSLPGFTVYATTTRPDITAALTDYTREDYGRIAGDALFGLLSGVVLAPLAGVLWALVPMVVLFLLSPLRKEGQPLFHWPTLLSLALAIAAYWVVKQATLAGVGGYVPFSAWIPRLSDTAASVMEVGVPVTIGFLGLLAAWAYTYRREKNSVLHFLIAYTVVDGALTAAIYGVLIYDAV